MDAELANRSNGQGPDPARRITAIVRVVVREAAPEELPVVDGLSAWTDTEIVARLNKRASRDERLGFGVDDVAVLVTPVLYIVLDQALRKGVDKSIDGLLGRLRRGGRRKVTSADVELSPQQIAAIRAEVADLARERGVPDDTIQRVDDAVTSALSDPPDGPDGSTPQS